MRKVTLLMLIAFLTPSLSPAQQAAKTGSVIRYEEARQMTQGFTRNLEGVQSYLYSKHLFLELLSQPDTEGIRFWYGRRDGRPVLVAAGTDASGQNDRGGFFVDAGLPCPPVCTNTLAPVQDVSRAGAIITADEADNLTQSFTRAYQGVRSHLYSADLFRRLFAQKGAEGLRVYPARKEGGPHLVFLATDGRGADLPGMALDNGASCPPDCP